MKNFFNFLYSTRLMAVLFILFATAMGVATFIENDLEHKLQKRWFIVLGGLKLS